MSLSDFSSKIMATSWNEYTLELEEVISEY